MRMFRNAGAAAIERHFLVTEISNLVAIDYTYRNRQDRQSGDVAFFYIDLKLADGTLLATHNQGQQTGLEFSETTNLGKPDTSNFAIGDEIIVSFRPYAAEYDFYRILLVSVGVHMV